MAYRLHFMMGCHHENGYIALGRVTQTGTIPSDPAASIPPAPSHDLLWNNVDQTGVRTRSPLRINN